ncbi:MAG: hypothetical protein ACOH5I_25560 [Oligoflexus sp.]
MPFEIDDDLISLAELIVDTIRTLIAENTSPQERQKKIQEIILNSLD